MNDLQCIRLLPYYRAVMKYLRYKPYHSRSLELYVLTFWLYLEDVSFGFFYVIYFFFFLLNRAF